MPDGPSFGENEEKAVLSLAFDHPEFLAAVCDHLRPEFFKTSAIRYVFGIIMKAYEEHGIIPTRELVHDQVMRELSADDDYEAVLAAVERSSNPREIPLIKDSIVAWCRNSAYRQLYSDEGLQAFEDHDYEKIDELIENARRITDVADGETLWFFEAIDSLLKEECEEKMSAGFKELDAHLNNGGPTRREVVCFMGDTNKGKSIILVNCGAAGILDSKNVLHVTCELSTQKTAQRYLGVFTDIALADHVGKAEEVREKTSRIWNTYRKHLVIKEFPPDEISVNAIYQLIAFLRRTRKWKPDIVVVDYLELMLSRNRYMNRDDYDRQKHVATEVRGLAKNEDVLVFTATQTNRPEAGKSDGVVGLHRAAESWGKMMPLDYVITLNQTKEEYEGNPPSMRFWIAKNRNGPRSIQVRVALDYNTMKVVPYESEDADEI